MPADKACRDLSQDREVLFWLLGHGADINLTDEDRQDSVFYADSMAITIIL